MNDKTSKIISFGAYIKKLRELHGLSMRDVENKCGVSIGYISMIESDKREIPAFKTLLKLAKAYSVSVTSLVAIAEMFNDKE